MTGALPLPDGPPRCPSCLALTPVDAHGRLPAFCSLCHAALDPAPSAGEQPAEPTELPAREGGQGGELPALDEQAVERMLIELQASDSDPWVARGSRVSTRSGKVLLGLGAAVAVLVVVLAVGALVGFLV